MMEDELCLLAAQGNSKNYNHSTTAINLNLLSFMGEEELERPHLLMNL
ncbi:MAG: hypothetical protein BACD_03699 [Bacteroides rodentium]